MTTKTERPGVIFGQSGVNERRTSFADLGARMGANGGGMVDYLIVAYPHPSGGWVAAMPDFMGVTGRGADIQQAIDSGLDGARDVCAALVAVGKTMPEPTNLESAKANHRWIREYGITWDVAVVRAISVPHPDSQPRRRIAKRESKVAAWSRRVAERNAGYNPAPAE